MNAAVRQFALQKILTDTSSLQSPITLTTQVSKPPPRDIWFKSMPLLLPHCLFSLIHLMSQTCFLFMTVDDWDALLQCQPCSRGERSRTWTNKNCHPLRGVQLTLRDECECLSVRLCVGVCIAFSLGVDILSLRCRGKKQANMSAQRCAVGKNGYETFWFSCSDMTTGRPTLLCNQPSLSNSGRHGEREETEEKGMMGEGKTLCSTIIHILACCVYLLAVIAGQIESVCSSLSKRCGKVVRASISNQEFGLQAAQRTSSFISLLTSTSKMFNPTS